MDFLFVIIDVINGNLSKSAFFERSGSLSANISGGRGQYILATPVEVEILEISLFRIVLRIAILTDDYFVL